MGLKGGYTIIDLSGYSFTAGTPTTVAGIFNKIKDNYGKPCLFTGIKVGTAVLKDQWVNVQQIAPSAFAIYIAGYAISIGNTDAVLFMAFTPLGTSSAMPTTNGTYTLKGTKNSSGFTYDWVKDE